jgi:hypothetical protein
MSADIQRDPVRAGAPAARAAGRRGLAGFYATLAAGLAVVGGIAAAGWLWKSELLQIPLAGDASWYRDFGGRRFPEIADEDLFFHGIGGSVDAAKAADIVILGPSFASYSFDAGTLRDFEKAHGIRIYNMSFIGIRSGEFTRRVIERWGIRPKLWIINVDDQFTSFFSRGLELTIGPHAEPIRTVQFSRLAGYLSVTARNLHWRVEDWLAGADARDVSSGKYRSITTGDIYLQADRTYNALDNKPLQVNRDQNCHASKSAIEIGRQYLEQIGARAVFTLVPHSQYCPRQARELAQALSVDAFVPESVAGYSTIDGGGHLDHRSAVRFTQFVLGELERSSEFKAIGASN